MKARQLHPSFAGTRKPANLSYLTTLAFRSNPSRCCAHKIETAGSVTADIVPVGGKKDGDVSKMKPPTLLNEVVVVCHKDIHKLAIILVIPGILVPTSYNNFSATELMRSSRSLLS
ncbi:hypothetical protein AHiyo8_03060 [Arthrobacter sp. Hiyo8]|nr:hypothetical protein AHiyo8_03060 [Arthrobacter sp. Hiyo8]